MTILIARLARIWCSAEELTSRALSSWILYASIVTKECEARLTWITFSICIPTSQTIWNTCIAFFKWGVIIFIDCTFIGTNMSLRISLKTTIIKEFILIKKIVKYYCFFERTRGNTFATFLIWSTSCAWAIISITSKHTWATSLYTYSFFWAMIFAKNRFFCTISFIILWTGQSI